MKRAVKKKEDAKERADYFRDYLRKKAGLAKTKKTPEELCANMTGIFVDFPENELEMKIRGMPSEYQKKIGIKNIKDFVYDILDGKGEMYGQRMIKLYNNGAWDDEIDKFMDKRGYLREKDLYIRKRGLQNG